VLGSVAWLLLVTAGAALTVAGAQEADRQREELSTNAYAAQALAGAVLFKLEEYSDAVGHAVTEPTLIEGLQRKDTAALQAFCKAMHARYDNPSQGLKRPGGVSPFDSWLLLGPEGNVLARSPGDAPKEYYTKLFDWRDYFKGAEQRAAEGQTPYISRAFLSEVDGNSNRFAISAPVLGPDGKLLAVLLALPGTGSALGTFQLKGRDEAHHRTAVLVAPRDRTREESKGPMPEDYLVLLHDALQHGDSQPLDDETTRILKKLHQRVPPVEGAQLRMLDPWPVETETHYRDPLAKDEGSWLAAFAPVGHTGFTVIVETRADAAVATDKALARRLMLWWGLPFLLGEALLGLLLWSSWRAEVRWREPRKK
jgi:serine/threonine-protein kinase